VRNEFAAVRLRVVPYGRGTRLEIVSERTGRTAAVDATVMEAMTALTGEELVDLVGTAIGEDPRGCQCSQPVRG
jgi:hypothetical protein